MSDTTAAAQSTSSAQAAEKNAEAWFKSLTQTERQDVEQHMLAQRGTSPAHSAFYSVAATLYAAEIKEFAEAEAAASAGTSAMETHIPSFETTDTTSSEEPTPVAPIQTTTPAATAAQTALPLPPEEIILEKTFLEHPSMTNATLPLALDLLALSVIPEMALPDPYFEIAAHKVLRGLFEALAATESLSPSALYEAATDVSKARALLATTDLGQKSLAYIEVDGQTTTWIMGLIRKNLHPLLPQAA